MKPIVCFFKEDQYIFSTKYRLFSCSRGEDSTAFLNRFKFEFPKQLKIVQVSYDAFQSGNTGTPENYPVAKASVFVLEQFELRTWNEINKGNDNVSAAPVFTLKIPKREFIQKVSAIKKMISAGRFYQINFTSFFESKSEIPAESFFVKMADSFKGRYRAFLPLTGIDVMSFSPELFLKKTNSTLSTAPIKGSMASGESLQNKLLDSEKESAELSMIVDLLRNDLNGLESKSSAVVTKHREIMDLNYIQHTYSEIEIKTEKDLPEILQKMMPGGSISGCPKKESLLAISELENYPRQVYTGAIGWWQDTDFEMNIAIRTFVRFENRYFYYAGCGIVYDSDPETEFDELINKAGRLNVIYE